MKTFAWPLALWFSAVTGLLTMFLLDGIWDVIGLALLATPLVAVGRHVVRAARPAPRSADKPSAKQTSPVNGAVVGRSQPRAHERRRFQGNPLADERQLLRT